MGERGQITIPKHLRHSLGIRAGEEVEFESREGALVVRRAGGSDPLEGLTGLLEQSLDVDAYLREARGAGWSAARDGARPRRPVKRKAKSSR